MTKQKYLLVLAILAVAILGNSCRQPIELPDGVQVLVNGQSIEGEKVIEVDQGTDVRLQVSGLQSSSDVDILIRKVGIKVHEETITVNSEGTVDEMIALPDIEIDVTVTVLINYVDWTGNADEMTFGIKLKS